MLNNLQQWFAEQQVSSSLSAEISNNSLELPWLVDPNSSVLVRRTDGKFFEVVVADVSSANGREVSSWQQPILRECDGVQVDNVVVTGVILLVRRRIAGGLFEYVVRAVGEPGNTQVPGNVLLAPTIQASFSNIANAQKKGTLPPMFEQLGLKPGAELIDFVQQSTQYTIIHKDGGRFIGKANLHAIKTLPDGEDLALSPAHTWATRQEINALILGQRVNEHLLEVLAVEPALDSTSANS